MSVAVVRASACASARARSASRDRRRARPTSTLTSADTATKAVSATRFSPSAIVKVWSGGVKNQFSSRKAATAATSPTARPPTAAMRTTAAR